jgi:N6-adenosine-specific RNA methylase IME4
MMPDCKLDVTGAPVIASSALFPVTVKFKTIVADPPWKYGAWGTPSDRPNQTQVRPMPYDTMSVDEICAMKVGDLADDDCELYLWTTQKYLPESFRVVEAWGFRYCGTLVWCKTPRGTGQGGLYCPTTEFLIHARRGKMPQDKRRQDSTWWNITRPHNCHSAKPEYFTDMIEAMGDAPRLELFARRNRLGWATWGNEALNHVELVTGNNKLTDGGHKAHG